MQELLDVNKDQGWSQYPNDVPTLVNLDKRKEDMQTNHFSLLDLHHLSETKRAPVGLSLPRQQEKKTDSSLSVLLLVRKRKSSYFYLLQEKIIPCCYLERIHLCGTHVVV